MKNSPLISRYQCLPSSWMRLLGSIILCIVATSVANAAAPSNDNFSGRKSIGTGTVTTDVTDATVEAGDPYTNTGHTVWFTWTAPADVIATIDNTGTDFDRNFFSVYVGGAINSLIDVVSGSGYSAATPYSRSFKAKAGTIFQISAGSYESFAYGTLKLTLTTTPFAHTGLLYGPSVGSSPTPVNDNFASRTTLSGSALTLISYVEDAGVEAGEPYTNDGHTVWYSWKATADTIVTLDTTGTDYERNFVAVYMGSTINNLITVTSRSGYSSSPYQLSFKAKSGTTFQICAGSYESFAYGTLQVTLTTAPFSHTGSLFGPLTPSAPTPTNDNFTSRRFISGTSLTVVDYNSSATVEAGEPSGLYKTLWYGWKPTSDATVTIDSTGTSFGYSTIDVYTGSSIYGLTLVNGLQGSSSTAGYRFTFNAKAGTEYKILAASTRSTLYGTLQFALTAIGSGSHPPFFSGEVSVGNGVYYLSFPNKNYFGYYSYLTDPNYIYHFDLGYEYVFDAADGASGVYFYDFTSGHFFYTSPTFPFPYLFDFTLNSVIYYYPDTTQSGHYTTNPRYFYNYNTRKIFTQ